MQGCGHSKSQKLSVACLRVLLSEKKMKDKQLAQR